MIEESGTSGTLQTRPTAVEPGGGTAWVICLGVGKTPGTLTTTWVIVLITKKYCL